MFLRETKDECVVSVQSQSHTKSVRSFRSFVSFVCSYSPCPIQPSTNSQHRACGELKPYTLHTERERLYVVYGGSWCYMCCSCCCCWLNESEHYERVLVTCSVHTEERFGCAVFLLFVCSTGLIKADLACQQKQRELLYIAALQLTIFIQLVFWLG